MGVMYRQIFIISMGYDVLRHHFLLHARSQKALSQQFCLQTIHSAKTAAQVT